MAYTPYYNGGWKIGVSGGTPIAAAALNHMEEGIAAAATLSDIIVASGEKAFEGVAANGGTSSATISIGKTLPNTNYLVITNPVRGNITTGIQSKTTSQFDLFVKNLSSYETNSSTGLVRWAVIRIG